jgi:beta-galactosidase
LLRNGVVVKTVQLKNLQLAAAEKTTVQVPVGKLDVGAEYALTIRYKLAEATAWASAGYEVAAEQLILQKGAAPVASVAKCSIDLKESANTLDLNGRDFSVRFDKKGGRITSLKSGGFECIAQGKDITGPELNIHCLPVGNDRPFRKSWAESDLAHPKSETVSFNASKQPDGSVVVSILKKIEYKGGSIEHQLDYTISDGVIKLSNKVTPDGLDEILTLPRMGLKMGLAKTFEQVEWVGRGPHENYPDRKSSAFIGTYKSTVTEMATPYVGAQEKGARCDVRRVKLSTPDKKAPAVVMEASEPFVFSALHCDAGNWQQPRKETILCIDHKMLGLGNGSCGPATLKRFWVPVQPYQFDFTLSVQ